MSTPLTPRPTRVFGNSYYLSPESLRGIVTPEADLWAATVVLYELFTLERPFTGNAPEWARRWPSPQSSVGSSAPATEPAGRPIES